jgi:hypothetical protein
MKKTMSLVLTLLIYLTASAQAPVNLRFNLRTGVLNQLRITNKQNVQTTYNGTPFITKATTYLFLSYTLLSQDKDIMSIEFKFDTIQSKTVAPMMTKETNSAIPAKSKEYLERMLNRFSANKIIAKISTSGKFIGFVNYKPFRDNILELLDSVPDNKKDQIRKQSDMILKESAVQSMIEPIFAYLPEKPVSPGDKWETTVQQSSGGISVMLFNTFTFDKLENGSVLLFQSTDNESIPSNEPNPAMSMDIKGKSTSKLVIELTTGAILNSSSKTHSEGNMKVKNQGNEMLMPLVIDSESEIRKIR